MSLETEKYKKCDIKLVKMSPHTVVCILNVNASCRHIWQIFLYEIPDFPLVSMTRSWVIQTRSSGCGDGCKAASRV